MPLRVAIVGAGIGGLSAAIALNRAGHDVEVFERSAFSNEVGAAIHVAPNATRILQTWDCDFSRLDPVRCDYLNFWNNNAEHVATPITTSKFKESLGVSEDWWLTHRVDLHNTLRIMALREIDGRRPSIRLSSKVASVDADTGDILFEDGVRHQADLIIGADGVHSNTARAVSPEQPKVESTGQNCFRFLIPMSKVEQKPKVKAMMLRIGLNATNILDSGAHRIVLYPCRGGKLVNVAVFCPSKPDEDLGKEAAWLSSGDMDELMASVSGFNQDIQDFCAMAEDLRLWSLATRPPLRIFCKGKVGLIGDAAHPMLPHQGQGGAQAIADAATLEYLLPSDTSADQVPDRLTLYNKIRYDHAVTVMMMSRVHDDKREKVMQQLREFVPSAQMPQSMMAYTWPSDPAREARELLRATLQVK